MGSVMGGIDGKVNWGKHVSLIKILLSSSGCRSSGTLKYLRKPLYVSCFLIAAMLIFVYGCSEEIGYTTVDFSEIVEVDRPDSRAGGQHVLRVAVAAMVSPKETFFYYQELLDYIGDRLHYSVQLIQRKTYGELNELFKKRQIDIAFICTGPYAVGKEKYGFEALATPIVRGKPFYYSYLIVNIDSPFQTFEDLRGRVFAFTDPESNTGFLVPIYWLSRMGERPNTFFGSFNLTYSHDNSILAVARGLVDGAAVDGHIWEYYNVQNPVHTSRTRIIKKSEPFGSPPLVASVYLPAKLKAQIRELLFSMHQNPDGNQILKELMIDRFTESKEIWYDTVREMAQKTQQVVTTWNESKKP